MKLYHLMAGCLILTLQAFGVEVGEQAPLFKAVDQDGKAWNLKEHLAEKPIVVYFYPAAMTGGCTKQACSYRDYVKAGNTTFQVVGISGDSVQNLKWFQTAEQLNFPLLSDPDGAIAKAFGVPVKTGDQTISRAVEGQEVELVRSATAARWTFVISSEGRIIYKAEKVKATEDLEQVVVFISESRP